ncbi:T9SS type A sorting domain-containing protein [Chitinophaga nivalis]|uniref:T9SS type A sorting domain-containing protein n=1 Tax=Chitinophaga nivalis TaxID=2991709 RepID=A0ABT3IU84_9BACT|nr:T9SS type A sorting domain-containing protein [Chitinophaga nivalis]MCW3463041.1 T9SS type A sorting domain-containing protein [Chitinophaga nivalis]MCW3487269.1 T9SS type A sorting domain-containing protein [Chitinophaga nivalis]
MTWRNTYDCFPTLKIYSYEEKNVTKTLFFLTALLASPALYAQSWLLTGNAGTNPTTNSLGTTDNNDLVFKTNNLPRVTLSSSQYGTLAVGKQGAEGSLHVFGRDIGGVTAPLYVGGNVAGLTWGNAVGQTMGRLIRLNQGADAAFGGINWYDIDIGQDKAFFITNHSVPPTSGNGVIRKRMLVISPDDRVGINLAGDVIGNGALPTANFHTNGTVRLQNLPVGTGYTLVADLAGNVYRSNATASRVANDSLQTQIDELKKEIAALKALLVVKQGEVAISPASKNELFQNAPNPFNAQTLIRYTLAGTVSNAYLQIADVNGRPVKKIDISGQKQPVVTINGGELPSGVYYYSLVLDGQITDTKKMVLTK